MKAGALKQEEMGTLQPAVDERQRNCRGLDIGIYCISEPQTSPSQSLCLPWVKARWMHRCCLLQAPTFCNCFSTEMVNTKLGLEGGQCTTGRIESSKTCFLLLSQPWHSTCHPLKGSGPHCRIGVLNWAHHCRVQQWGKSSMGMRCGQSVLVDSTIFVSYRTSAGCKGTGGHIRQPRTLHRVMIQASCMFVLPEI